MKYSRQRQASARIYATRRSMIWVLVAWACLAFWPTIVASQPSDPLGGDKHPLAHHAQDRSEDAVQFGEWTLGELGPGNHSRVAASLLSKRASLYRAMGRYDDAEHVFEQLLALLEAELGSEHPRVIFALNNLATLYLRQEKYGKAEPVYAKALKALEGVLGSQHHLVAQGLDNLAGVYNEQGKFAEAEPLFERALAIRITMLGRTHPRVGESLNNLAGLYTDQGEYLAAEPLYLRSLAILDHAFGTVHPLIAATLDSFAVVLRNTGRRQQAANAESHAEAIRATWLRRVHGPEI